MGTFEGGRSLLLDPAMVSNLTSDEGVCLSGALKNLSPRELQVLGLMVKAHSDRAIAEALFIQPRTVEHHISSVLAKLGFNSNGERHGRVFAILTYLESTGQLPMNEGDVERSADVMSPIQMIAYISQYESLQGRCIAPTLVV
ncbi:MAG: helix-turn-helix transcriptional regulator [Chloroflexi bacterium]|jgi:DNA-binding CsgD family transcriptional regulator|nr:helix-turn-helix transcriptional regulator [Chloroflexota bacterium]